MIDVLFFAAMQEKVGKAKVRIQAENISVKEMKKKYLSTYEMDDLLAESMIAVNEEYSTEDHIIVSGDTVAFIPPVSGG